mmetsp:Transcript_20498/g.24851  ORF Transcript_20498/g.24851 Transcript_20498/m.24851 type:complete len:538 (+) Transcript_20498:369-1982(+)
MTGSVSELLRAKLVAAKQEHVLKFLDEGELSKSEEEALVSQLETFDYEMINGLFKSTVLEPKTDVDETISPMPEGVAMTIEDVKKHKRAWEEAGCALIAEGAIAFITLSGGQGTRLGYDGPKGMYDIGLPSHKSLFRLYGERLLHLRRSVQLKMKLDEEPVIPWYIMTSPLNHDTTCSYFEQEDYFELGKENVFLFKQGTLPCFTEGGKFILENKYTVATAPDGNGGIYNSLKNSGAFDDMQTRNIKWVQVTSVDNSLVQVADPVFIGCCETKKADVGNLSCPKAAWNEKVGVVAMKGGAYHIVEYSEIDEDMAKQTDANGLLVYRSGNICNHCFSMDFLRLTALPALQKSYHIAKKKIPYVDEATGETVKPNTNNGIKLEMFIFDVFPLSKNMVVVECERAYNFAPVKNAPSTDETIAPDSPQSAQNMIFSMCKEWLVAAGAKVDDSSGNICEVTPLVSINGESLSQYVSGCTLVTPLLVAAREDFNDAKCKSCNNSGTDFMGNQCTCEFGAAKQVPGCSLLKHLVKGDVNVYLIN